MDAVSLFPSLSARNTGQIVKRKVEESPMKVEGFQWKKAMVYIKVNQNKVASKMSKELRRYLPIRKAKTGTEPGMQSKGLGNKDGSKNKQ